MGVRKSNGPSNQSSEIITAVNNSKDTKILQNKNTSKVSLHKQIKWGNKPSR